MSPGPAHLSPEKKPAQFPFLHVPPFLQPTEPKAPLNRTPSALLTSDRLNEIEQNFEERIRTLCLVICASAVLLGAAYAFKSVLIPFVLALALTYLFSPLIDMLSCRNQECPTKLPRFIATLITLAFALAILAMLAYLMALSISEFSAHANTYSARIEFILAKAYNVTKQLEAELGVTEEEADSPAITNVGSFEAIKGWVRNISLTDFIIRFLGTAAHMTEDIVYVLLFMIFMVRWGIRKTWG
jgi:predicted PurR-regulated permease PerM